VSALSLQAGPYEAIRNLLGTYCELIDAGDFEGLGCLFANATLTDDRGRIAARGAADATALWTGLIKRYDGSPRTRHTVSGPVIEVREDGTASCRSAFVVFQQLGPGRLEPIASGRYRDEFACTDEEWRFTSRQFFLDHTGDVSQHMTEA
jgi:3-phenylpropionate/cinnamic acid dioxygenase small subunit